MDFKKINLKQIRDFSRNSPIYFSLGFTLLVTLLNQIFANLFYLLPPNIWMDILYEVVCIIWPVALVVIFGYSFSFRRRGIRATFGASWFLFVFYGILLISQVGMKSSNPDMPWKSDLEIFYGILMLIGIGIREEILFRGVITNAIALKYASSTKGLWITVLSAGAMFGAIHLSNVFTGASFTGALVQAIGCFGGGALLCAIYLRGGSIWVVALLHSLRDAPGFVDMLFISAPGSQSASEIISGYGLTAIPVIAVDLLLTAFLLRKSKRQKILDRIERLKSSEMAEF